MQTYFVCYRYTDEGRLTPGASRHRLPLLKKSVGDLGGEFVGFYLTMGDHDTIAIVRFPDDVTVGRFILASTMKGYVQTSTIKVFSETEYLQIIDGLPGS